MHICILRVIVASVSLAAPCVWASCPKSTPFVCACTTEVACCGGLRYPLGGCAQRSETSVENGPFACVATGLDKECIDGISIQTDYCFIRYACTLTTDKGCISDASIVTEVQSRVIKVEKSCEINSTE